MTEKLQQQNKIYCKEANDKVTDICMQKKLKMKMDILINNNDNQLQKNIPLTPSTPLMELYTVLSIMLKLTLILKPALFLSVEYLTTTKWLPLKIHGWLIHETAMPPNILGAEYVTTLPMSTKIYAPMTKVEVWLALISIVDGKCESVTSLVSC